MYMSNQTTANQLPDFWLSHAHSRNKLVLLTAEWLPQAEETVVSYVSQAYVEGFIVEVKKNAAKSMNQDTFL